MLACDLSVASQTQYGVSYLYVLHTYHQPTLKLCHIRDLICMFLGHLRRHHFIKEMVWETLYNP